jgi:hypothetical protein
MSSGSTLRRGDLLPHFTVRTLAGDVVDYRTSMWQRRTLALVMLGEIEPDADLSTRVEALNALTADDNVCVVTRDAIDGAPSPGIIVADRWGEIVHVGVASSVCDLPTVAELAEWLEHLAQRCPECEGETL